MSEDVKGQEGFLLIYPDFSTAVPTGKKNKHGNEIVEYKDTIVAFRVYEYCENGKYRRDGNGKMIFKDYRIRHHNLKIKLLDGKLYETEQGNYIDY